jgi:hypothetical protein
VVQGEQVLMEDPAALKPISPLADMAETAVMAALLHPAPPTAATVVVQGKPADR